MIDIVPYRMGVMSLLVLPLIVLYGIRLNKVTIAYGLLFLTIALSAVINGSSLSDFLLFTRILVFSYLIYYLTERFINRENVEWIIRLCVIIAVIQLPVVLFQFATYDWLPAHLQAEISAIDYDFGTFNFKGDSSMTFFLTLLVTFLLFDKKRNHIIPYRTFVVIWLTITVLIANAEIVKLIMVLVWIVYFATHLNRKVSIYLFGILVTILMIFLASGLWFKIGEDVTYKMVNEVNKLITGGGVEVYLRGGYARGGALYYFFTNDLLILGDGPSRYVDPITREYIRGNFGHLFTFYSEVGILGWLFSMLIFFQIAFKYHHHGRMHLTWVTTLSFMAIFILSFTSQIMNDISLVLIYCIIAKSYLIPPKMRRTQTISDLQDRYPLPGKEIYKNIDVPFSLNQTQDKKDRENFSSIRSNNNASKL